MHTQTTGVPFHRDRPRAAAHRTVLDQHARGVRVDVKIDPFSTVRAANADGVLHAGIVGGPAVLGRTNGRGKLGAACATRTACVVALESIQHPARQRGEGETLCLVCGGRQRQDDPMNGSSANRRRSTMRHRGPSIPLTRYHWAGCVIVIEWPASSSPMSAPTSRRFGGSPPRSGSQATTRGSMRRRSSSANRFPRRSNVGCARRTSWSCACRGRPQSAGGSRPSATRP
jgi:hypothetical protein